MSKALELADPLITVGQGQYSKARRARAPPLPSDPSKSQPLAPALQRPMQPSAHLTHTPSPRAPQIHDVLVAQPLYKQLYDTAMAVPAFVTGTGLYRAGYPLVAPVADPVISNFTKSTARGGALGGGQRRGRAAGVCEGM